jgi:tetratricopeptide (TPR) repeat protein
VTFLGIATYSAWLETPVQGVLRGYAYRLSGHVMPGDALVNAPRLLSYALPCGLAVASTIVAKRWRRLGWLQLHAGAAMLVTTFAFAATLAFRSQALLESLVAQGQDRAAIQKFAQLVGSYSRTAPALDLAGTDTLADRVATAFQLIGYGWWFAGLGSAILLLTLPPIRRRLAVAALAAWGAAALAVVSLIGAPAWSAESERLQGEALYAAGHYPEALDRFRESLRRAPAQRLNAAFQSRLGATLVWMGDRASPQARLFLAANLGAHGEPDKAAIQLVLALDADPHSWLARRRLAELQAELGVLEFKRGQLGERSVRWERALALDPTLLRVRYYLAHAYHRQDDRDQARAIGQVTELIALVRYPVTLSDLYALLGDCYFKERRDVQARAMYRRALRVVPLIGHMNLHAQRGLLGL